MDFYSYLRPVEIILCDIIWSSPCFHCHFSLDGGRVTMIMSFNKCEVNITSATFNDAGNWDFQLSTAENRQEFLRGEHFEHKLFVVSVNGKKIALLHCYLSFTEISCAIIDNWYYCYILKIQMH